MQPNENNTKYFTRLVGNQVRITMPPCYPSWTEDLEEQRTRLHRIIESYFDLQGDRSLDEYRTVCAAVDRLAVDRYHDYKLNDKLVELRETIQTQVATSGASLDKRAIAKEVLEERRGHVCGVARVPNVTSLSLDSTTVSKAPQETSHQFSGDPPE
ncbi:hypothetical protein Adt_05538 [Abeliophyllum distichum]|uniref:Uncharacterized protein n=1 Tax=Abeliophyllum distichum TaxID=126358 RepID=A0ABD1V4D5_9LAMI